MKLFAIPLSTLLTIFIYISGYSQATVELPLHVNVGSTIAYTSTNSTNYIADQPWSPELAYGYIGGGKLSLSNPIGGTEDASLYQVQRSGLSEYRAGQLPNGQYTVILHFAELIAHNPHETMFDLIIEDQLVLDDFDPFVATQNTREYAIVYRFLTQVSDGMLNVQFVPAAGQAQLAAISIQPYTPSTSAPTPPTDLISIPSFETVILDWAEQSVADTQGYFVYRAPNAEGQFARITDEPVRLSRYIDQFDNGVVITGTEAISMPSQINWYYRLTTVDLEGNESLQSPAIVSKPLGKESTSLPVYQLEISEAELARLSLEPDDKSRHPARLTYEGSIYDVEVRYRGQVTRGYAKKSWKIVFGGDSPFPNRKHVDLKSHYDDISLIRGVLTTQLYSKIGIAPSNARHALLFVNGEYFGVYTDFERVDENFLKRTDRNPNSTIYETLYNTQSNYGSLLQASDYPLSYELRTNKHLGFKPLIDFLERVNSTPNQYFAQSIEAIFNVRNYLKYYAGVIFTGNLDFTRHNVFFVSDPETNIWEIIPWDPDLTWGNEVGFNLTYTSGVDIDAGIYGGYETFNGPNIFLTKIIELPQYRGYYCSQLRTLSDDQFITQQIYPLIDNYHQAIKTAVYADWRKYGWESTDGFDKSLVGLKRFALERGQFLRVQIASFCPDPKSLLTINEVATNSHTVACDPDERSLGACSDQWLEIYNPGLTEVDLQGMYLTDDPAVPMRFRFNESVIVPPSGYVLIWADNEPWQGPTHTNFYIMANAPSLSLFAEDGMTLIDQMNINERGHNIFSQRYPDGAKNIYITGTAEASPGFRNRLAATIRHVSTVPTEPDAGQETIVTVNLFPENEFIEGSLYYHINGQSQSVPLKRTAYGQFSGVIPEQSDQAHVEYYLTIKSYTGEEISPASAGSNGEYYQFLVGYHKPLLKINEIRAVQDSGVLSWFEIYNSGNVAVDVGGMYLSDDLTNPRKYMIPSDLRPIQPGGFTVFYANGTPTLSSQHTNFVLERTDGVIILSDRDETFNQPITAHSYAAVPDYGALQLCSNNSSLWSPTQSPTPGYANSPACNLIFVPSLLH